ncbi:DUF350 domain-containing protein [Gammaproteobacteria bacterium]|nr:DUF350 domain-containing protein [Gammaproteobacteria bacterium]
MFEYLFTGQWVQILIVNIVLVVLIMALAKYVTVVLSKTTQPACCSIQDNPAFGISVAGTLISLSIILTGVISGDASNSLVNESLLVLSYGIGGILLMIIARILFDSFAMRGISLKQEIAKGNIACAVVEAGHLISSAIILRAMMLWVEEYTLQGVLSLVVGYAVSQLLLNLVSAWRLYIYNRHHKSFMQTSLLNGNLAVAIRFSGIRIAIASAITAGAGFIAYADSWLSSLSLWLGFSLLAIAAVSFISLILDKIILKGIDIRQSVDTQKNVSVATIQASITFSVSLIIVALLG